MSEFLEQAFDYAWAFVQEQTYAVVAVVAVLVLAKLYSLGTFKRIDLFVEQYGPQEIVYIEYQGDYPKVGPHFQKLYKAMKGVFNISSTFGLFYDNPGYVVDKSQCRAIIGIAVNAGEPKGAVQNFLTANPEFKYAYLPCTQAVKSSLFPLKSQTFSFYLFVNKFYPVLMDYMRSEECKSQLQQGYGGVMEIYGRDYIQGVLIAGARAREYLLSTFPEPERIPAKDE